MIIPGENGGCGGIWYSAVTGLMSRILYNAMLCLNFQNSSFFIEFYERMFLLWNLRLGFRVSLRLQRNICCSSSNVTKWTFSYGNLEIFLLLELKLNEVLRIWVWWLNSNSYVLQILDLRKCWTTAKVKMHVCCFSEGQTNIMSSTRLIIKGEEKLLYHLPFFPRRTIIYQKGCFFPLWLKPYQRYLQTIAS